MTSAGQLLYDHLGRPPVAGLVEVESLCWVCGGTLSLGVCWEDWAGSNFVGQNRVKAPSSEYVCAACVYICGRTNPVPGRPPKEGKQFGGSFRNYSHLYDSGDSGCYRCGPMYINASKGEKPVILAWLKGPHVGAWFAAIADSGQKHVLPWVPVNPAGTKRGIVLFDEQIVRMPASFALVDQLAMMLTAGATKDSVKTGEYTPREWHLAEKQIVEFETRWGQLRGGAWFCLALWLAQRDEVAVTERLENEARRDRKGKAKNADGGGVARHSSCTPRKRSKPVDALDTTADANALSSSDDSQPGGVDNVGTEASGNPGCAKSEQLSLL